MGQALLLAGERTPQEWADYCREGERDSVRSTIDWCRRIYQAKQSLQISFREWAVSYYETYSFSSLMRLSKIGEQSGRLSSITTQKQVANDWGALYKLTTLSDDEIARIEGPISQSSLKALEYGHGPESGDEWYTPSWLFDGLGIRFSIDVCAPEDQTHIAVPAASFFTIQDDGLAQPWHGTIWCNPPYSAAAPWAERCIDHGDGLLLSHIPANAEWCADVWQCCDGIRLFQAMEFVRPDGVGQRPGYWLQLAAFGDVAKSALLRLATPADVAVNPRRVPSPMFWPQR